MAGCGPVTSGAGAHHPATPVAGSATSSPPPLCGTITSLRAALADLTHVKPDAQASGQIAADLLKIKAKVQAVNKAAAAYGAHAGSLNQAVDSLGLAARAAALDPSSATIAALGAALSGLKASVQGLIAGLKAACPGS